MYAVRTGRFCFYTFNIERFFRWGMLLALSSCTQKAVTPFADTVLAFADTVIAACAVGCILKIVWSVAAYPTNNEMSQQKGFAVSMLILYQSACLINFFQNGFNRDSGTFYRCLHRSRAICQTIRKILDFFIIRTQWNRETLSISWAGVSHPITKDSTPFVSLIKDTAIAATLILLKTDPPNTKTVFCVFRPFWITTPSGIQITKFCLLMSKRMTNKLLFRVLWMSFSPVNDLFWPRWIALFIFI